MVWREQGGKSRLAAVMKDGKVVALTTDDLPQVAVLQPVPPSWRMKWRMPGLALSLAVLFAFVFTWPVAALARRAYGQRFALAGRAAMLHRAARATALLDLAFVLAWVGTFVSVGSDISRANASLDPVLRAEQVLGVLGLIGLVFVVWNLVEVWRGKDRSWWAKTASLLLLLACLFVDWTLFDVHAFNLSLAY